MTKVQRWLHWFFNHPYCPRCGGGSRKTAWGGQRYAYEWECRRYGHLFNTKENA